MSLYRGDMRAAYIGLVGGALVLSLLLYTIVHLTNRKFEGHRTAAAAEH
jgi:hypothetical protein